MSDAPLFPADKPTEETPAAVPGAIEAATQGQVLYRKWRPQTFAEVAGQDAVTRTLRNAIAAGNLAHAYLFCGPRGTGKTTLGRLLAKAANCDSTVDGEPCNKCESCLSFIEGRAMDFIEQDAASHNSVDDVRQLRENVVLTPMAGRRKVYLLDEVHMLSTQAQNALLKTLEEPPAHIIFVLATTEAHKVASTIVSRCQRFDLKRIALAGVAGRLSTICEREEFTFDERSLQEVARASTGSLRDAINALEQVVSYYGPSPTLDQVKEALGLTMDARSGLFARASITGDLGGALGVLAAVRDDGVDSKQFSAQVVQYLRGLLLVQAGVGQSLNLPEEVAEEIRAAAKDLPRSGVLRALRAFGVIDWGKERDGPGSSLPLELALIDACHGDAVVTMDGEAPTQTPPTPAPPTPEISVAAAEVSTVHTAVTALTGEVSAGTDESSGTTETDEVAPIAGARSSDLLEQVRSVLRQADRPQADKQLAALLNGSCEIAAVEEARVVLGFYHTFHLERVEGGGFRSTLEGAFGSVLGRPVSVAYEHRPRGPADAEPAGAGGHLVRAARERFGARAVPQDD